MAKDLAVILNNGSVNSAVATALAAQKYRPILLYVDAGSAGSRLHNAYEQQVTHFKPYREHVLAMPFLTPLQATTNTQAAMASDPRAVSLLGSQMMCLLPLIAAAARYAVHYQAAALYLGLRVGPHGDELAQATEYVQIWNEMLSVPCAQPEMEVIAPLLELEPWQVVDVGFQVNAPLDKAWSCLEESPEPCWACVGCRQREAAFQQSGKPDPMRAVRR